MRRFKCFDALELPCAPLTVLTGYNAAGKSTALHSILLMAQALRSNPRSDRLVLNGSLVALGSGGDVLRHGTKSLRLGARRPGEEALWTFGHDRNLSYRGLMPLVAVQYTRNGELYESYDKLFPDAIPSGAALLTALRDTIFLGADRAVHLGTYPVPRSPWQVAGNVGSRGEYAPYWYLEYDEAVVPERRHRRERDKRESVHIQSEAWLGELFPGARMQAKRLSPDSPVELSFRLGTQGSWARPPNIGFGLGYAFPMIVALLTASPGSLIVIDSAEAHLHPRAQSVVGRMLGQMAGAGLQIFVETHSDHLLNGVRLAVRDGLLGPQDVALHFFSMNPDGTTGQVTALSLDPHGAIDSWPEGFFDQAERDLAVLAGWG